MRKTFVVLVLLAIVLLGTVACETPVEDTSAPTEIPTVATPASLLGIGVSRAEMQVALEEDPFGFTFGPLSNLADGRSRMLGYVLEEGQEGMVELIGPPSNLTEINLVTPITGAYSRTGLSRLTELASYATPEGERGQGADAWVVDHILLAIEEGPQRARYSNICLEMQWHDNLQMVTLVLVHCSP